MAGQSFIRNKSGGKTAFHTALARFFQAFYILIFLVSLLGMPFTGVKKVNAAVAIPQAWTNVYHAAAYPSSAISYTVNAGPNRMLVVAISSTRNTEGTQTASVTYGGQTLTKQITDETGAYRQHTWLFHLNEAGLVAATNSNLVFTMSGGTSIVTDVFATVFTGVDQSASPIRDSKNYTSGTSNTRTLAFNPALTVNAGDQAVEIINSTRSGNTNPRTIAYAANWTMAAQQTYSTTDGIRNAVANRSIPTSDTTDTSSTTFSGNALGSMSAMSIKSNIPIITTTGTLSDFNTAPGFPSTAQTYTVTGSNLTADISIAAPTGFELSTNGTTYDPALTLTQSGGSVPTTTIYVRLYSATEGSYSGSITHTSSGAITQNVTAGGTVSSITCTNVSLTATEDTYLSANDVTYNNGGNVELHVDVTTGTARRTALLKWDLSSIPANATVSSASLTLNVLNVSPYVYNLYNMRRTWVEGTSSRTASSTSANWNTYDGTNSWGTVGAANPSSDRFDTNLWSASTSSFTTTGIRTEALSSDGIAVVQGWIAGTTSNYGLIMQNYSGPTNNAVYFSSSENATVANRPQLNVSYCYPIVATITTSGTLSTFSSSAGTPSAAQTYTVSGSYLTDNIIITAPANFELSINGSAYSSNLELYQTDGVVPSTTIYVRLYSATEGSFSGNIIHTSTGASDKTVSVSGTAANIITATFQYGASGYIGTVDTFIRGTTEGNTNFSAITNLDWDDNTGTTTDEIALIRFTDIFNSEGGPIPDGATITSASLTYWTTDLNSGSTALGDPANVYESLVDWPGSTVTWNNFGGEAGVQADEYNSTLVASAVADALSTAYSINVTTSLQSWAANPAANLGWIFLPTADDGVNIYSSDFATVAYRPLLSVSYATSGSVNLAPDQPVLVQPADNATGVGTPPVLQVTVSDPDAADTLEVSFYGRPVSTSEGEEFTIVVIPDPQNLATSYPALYTSTLQWIADNDDISNIVFATAVGDLVNTASSSTEYSRADAAFDILDGDVMYSVGPGNHDMGAGTLWPANFGTSRFSGKSYYGGSYDEYNTYHLFNASGMDFILINLQYSPTTAILDWADGLLTTYSNRRAIVEQHDILNINNTFVNQTSYNALRDHDNLFLMLSGHMHSASDGAAYVAGSGTGGAGQTIHITMQDYQEFTGVGYLRIYRFSPANDMIYMTTYSPTSGGSITSTSNYDTADLAYPMTSSAAYTLIGTVSDVANGANASISWTGLTPGVEYEWYASVSDGSLTTNGSTWSFTAGSPTAANLNYFRAWKANAGVELTWETVSEATTAGFNLYRRELSGDFVQINDFLIPPQAGGQPQGATYTYLDAGAMPGQLYEYKLEVISTSLAVDTAILVTFWPFALSLPMVAH